MLVGCLMCVCVACRWVLSVESRGLWSAADLEHFLLSRMLMRAVCPVSQDTLQAWLRSPILASAMTDTYRNHAANAARQGTSDGLCQHISA